MAKATSETNPTATETGTETPLVSQALPGVVTVNAVDADPAERSKRAKSALDRQRTNKPPRDTQTFVVEATKGSEVLRMNVKAATPTDAWAMACEQWKYFPGGQAPGRRVMTVEEARAEDAKRRNELAAV